MSTAFNRQLGSQSGVQLNPLRDMTDGYAPDNSDQVFGIVMRATRGRIDKPFRVNRGNFQKKLGRGESLRASALNEAHIHVYEALQKGAASAVVQRLTTSTAVLSTIIVTQPEAPATDLLFTVAADVPTDKPFLLSVKHLECYNDGIVVELHADAVTENGVLVANRQVTLRLRDKDRNTLYEFVGSLNPDAVDDYQQSAYLPDVVERTTDNVEVLVGHGAQIAPTSNAYGRDANGRAKVAISPVMAYFTEGSTAYGVADFARARDLLQKTEHDYAYIVSGGSHASALLSALAQLAYDTNRQFAWDVPGTLSPEAAIAFMAQLNFDSHYCQAFWAPLKSDDPLGLNGKVVLGTSAYNVARRCLRNAQIDANGFAPKNYPIAGKNWPLDRTGIVQIYSPDDDLSDLADAKINPVIYVKYNGGGKYVFSDSLTCAKTAVSMKKLISVADMSSSIDDWVTRFAKEALQLPMEVSVKKTDAFLKKLFKDAKTAKWIVPSAEMDGEAFQYVVQPNALRPADRMDVSYSLKYDGTNRQTFVTQTLSR
ncbi:hypothetical protein [Collimonas humicola]|uniref:hypothetical protein n=1 Tax=Collimonas humicola TaxID=2825886 RepID=UPI001B8BA868|nr:hypothetical protein [Collimonas humicola]